MEPPPCIQNAMLTKDKKPFTYTPGGLNLNEIRSPRMARRIERNAAYEGVGSTPAQQNRPQVAPGSLPPSAIAAMQPQMHVQVFPTGPPPPPPMNHLRGGVPPPPPPMSNIPPPPPPPTQPLPTQKVRTSDQQVVERPDMTKIIPENPMGLLKKTGGPKIKNTLLEEMYRNPEGASPQQVPMGRNYNQQLPSSPQPQQVRSPPLQQVRSPPPQAQQVRSPPPQQVSPPIFNTQHQPQMIQRTAPSPQAWSPPVIERKESPRTTNQQPSFPQQPERNVNVGCIYIPPMNPQQNKNVASPPPAPQPQKVQTPGTPTLKEAPKPWQQKQQDKQDEPPQWTRREPSFSTTPVPQEQHTPQSASFNQQQRPRWPQNDQIPPNVQQVRPQDPRASVQQQMQQGPPEVYTQRVLQPQFDPTNHPNAVFITQPIILQHPGPNYGPPVINRRENVPLNQEGGIRTIPIQIEGRETPNDNRNLNRQQSWSSNPSQSGSFRIIQKITGTDGEEDDYNGATEHTARYPQQFPAEQMRKMQLNESDQQLLNRFKQAEDIQMKLGKNSIIKPNLVVEMYFDEENPRYRGGHIPSRVFRILDQSDVDTENYLHGESTEPRYKGATIPSKAFRLLQNMTDEPNKNSNNVPNNEAQNKPQVRTIPIQIEGNGGPKNVNYVPPSQQVPADEPKKYTGSSIPSRSFRMLQAMTAPDSCANAKEANETNENYDFPYQGNNWGFPPAYPMYNPQPYWPPYYSTVPYKMPSTEHSNSDPELNRASASKTPQPYFGYPPYTPTKELEQKSVSRTPSSFSRCSSSTELENINWRQTPIPYPMYPSPTTPVPGRRTPRKNMTDSDSDSKTCTPVPFWYGYPPPESQEKMENGPQEYNYYPPYPPYYDPYYFPYYYYGYPPMFSPMPFMRPGSDPEDLNGYSSMDEMSYYTQKNKNQNTDLKESNTVVTNASPEIVVTPTPENNSEIQKEHLSSDSDTDTETNDVDQGSVQNSCKLQTIRSVPDINIYKQSDDESEVSEADDESDASSNSSVYEEDREEEVVPHQLSIIFEVSEVTDTPRLARESSVFSDCTTIEGMRSDDEDVEDPMSKQWISDNLMEIASRIKNRIDARIELDDSEVFASFTMKTPSPKRDIVNKNDEVRNQHKEDTDGTTGKHETVSVTYDSIIENEAETYERVEECNESECKDTEEMYHKEEENYSESRFNCQENNEEATKSEIDNNGEVCEDTSDCCQEQKPMDKVATETPSKESSDSEDWWGVIGKTEDDFPVRKSNSYYRDSDTDQAVVEQETVVANEETSNTNETENIDQIFPQNDAEITDDVIEEENCPTEDILPENPSEDDVFCTEEVKETKVPKLEITSAHSSHSSESSRKVSCEESDDSSESEDSDSSEDEKEENKHDVNNNEPEEEEETIVIPSIKDRIKALQECITVKKKSHIIEEEIRISVKSQVESIDSGEVNKSKPISAKSSVKSFDEISEEDSGVTDLSKQYSDNEEFPELRKMSKYQRASTHSRLFQLLQEECENEEEETDLETRKNHLSLPLNSDASDKLAEELVHSMLKQKQGQIFRNMSVDKLHAAAKKVLQEDGDNCDTPSEGFSDYLSPLRNDTGNSTPQEFYGHYNEYMQYYDSWAQAAALQEKEIIQSNTFRMIQDLGQKANNYPTTIAKCPRVLSGKNIHSDLKKLVESPEESSTNIPDPKS